MEWERGCILATCLGVMRRQLEACVRHAQTRKQFGRAIGSFQAVKHMCAEMLLRSQQASVAATDAAAAVADPDESQLSIAVAVAAALRVRGSGGTPPEHGGWRPLELPEH